MDFTESPDLAPIREAVRALCARFGDAYWRGLEPDRYPSEFVAALTEDGWLAALIPEHYGGSGLPLAAACVILEEICASGGNAGACHAQMYMMGTLLRHGSDEQKRRYLPRIAAGELRLQAFARDRARRRLGHDADQDRAPSARPRAGVVNGQKIWTSRARALRPDGAARAHDARSTEVREGAPTVSRCSSSTCATAAPRFRSSRSRR